MRTVASMLYPNYLLDPVIWVDAIRSLGEEENLNYVQECDSDIEWQMVEL